MNILGIIDSSIELDNIVSVNSTLLVEKVDGGVKVYDYADNDISKVIADYLANDDFPLVNGVIKTDNIENLFDTINVCHSLLGVENDIEIGYDFK